MRNQDYKYSPVLASTLELSAWHHLHIMFISTEEVHTLLQQLRDEMRKQDYKYEVFFHLKKKISSYYTIFHKLNVDHIFSNSFILPFYLLSIMNQHDISNRYRLLSTKEVHALFQQLRDKIEASKLHGHSFLKFIAFVKIISKNKSRFKIALLFYFILLN